MSRPEFENQTLISAMTNKTIKVLRVESTTTLAQGVYDRYTIKSPANTVSRLFNAELYYAPINNGTTGNKEMIIDMQISPTQGIGLWRAVGLHSSDLYYDQGHFKGATSFFPNDLGAVSNQLQAVKFDETLGMQVVFRQDTTAPTGALRRYTLFLEEEVVAR